MHNPYHPEPAKIVKITPLTETAKLFSFKFEQKVWGYNFSFQPGQFVELSLPGWGEAPFAPCNDPKEKFIELCVRAVGHLTAKLHSMKIGDKVGIRGPYGQGWPTLANSQWPIANGLTGHPDPTKAGEESIIKDSSPEFTPHTDAGAQNNNYLLVVGGLGLVPLRTLILGKDKFLGQDTKVQIFYGARVPEEMLFRYEFDQWRQNGIEVNLTIDKECHGWSGCVGLVTALFEKKELLPNPKVLLCGPPVMFKAVMPELQKRGIPDQDIFLSLERRMHCGIGVCQHCAVGPYYTCKDGPVFRYDKIKNIPGAI